MYALVINSFKTTPAVRRVLPCAFYHPQHNPLQAPQVHSTTKVDDFYINPSYPDDSETPPTMTQRRTSVHATQEWQELNATQSEADVKADRGEAVAKKGKTDDLFSQEEPKIDEM
ncbi:hypothetical protein BDW62DRAFT_200931 [Aspergillus aurantiobrunneus]